ncbi:MAG: SDR family oxidoreductase, partial [Hyphomicrobiales bacterium]|nr:SDR family oxidoreductase [Hyphomicrobiales bacterium]
PLAAVVNSFGFGGANASIVLQQASQARRRDGRAGEVFAPIAGSNAELIKRYAAALARAIEAAENRDAAGQVLRDVAFTLQSRNENRPVRAVIRASALSELKSALAAMAAGSRLPEDTAIFGPAPSRRADWPDHVWLWLKNGGADWPDIPDAKRLPLPISPWPDKPCWFEERDVAKPQATGFATAEFSYLRPVWRPKAAVAGRRLDDRCIWLIGRDDEQVEAFRAELREHLPVKATLLTSVVKRAATGPEPSLEVWNLAGDEPDIIVLLPERNAVPDLASQEETRILFGLAKELMERSFGRNVDVFYVASQGFGAAPAIDALAALAKSAFLENERLRIHTLYLGDRSRADWPSLLAAELAGEPAAAPLTIRYAPSRALRQLGAAELDERQAPPTSWFRDGGVYLAPGGAGELGYRLLEKLLEATDAIFILSGRSPCEGAVKQRVDALAAKAKRPDRVRYIKCDIADLDQTRAMVRTVAERHGRVNGILNLVTAHNDAYLFNKSWEDFAAVSASKVQGTINLDLATSDLALDVFVAFSSLASLGFAGGADYAYGCAFQNAFAAWRAREVAAGRRHGASQAISWSRWQWDKYVKASFDDWFASLGFAFLDAERGLEAWRAVMRAPAAEVFVLYGRPDLIFKHLDVSAGLLRSQHGDGVAATDKRPTGTAAIDKQSRANGAAGFVDTPPLPQPAIAPESPSPTNGSSRRAELEQALSEIVSGLLKLDALDPASSFASIGLDSVMAIRLIMLVEKRLSKRLTPKALLAHPSVAQLADHMLSLDGSSETSVPA